MMDSDEREELLGDSRNRNLSNELGKIEEEDED